MNISYFCGVVVGILVFIVLTLVLRRSLRGEGKEKPQYDERQQIVRGRACMWAFSVLLPYVAAMSVADLWTSFVRENLSAFAMIGAVLSCGVFGIYSVWNDAYVQVGLNPRRYMLLITAIGLLNLGIGISSIIAHPLYGGKTTSALVNLVLGAILLAMALTLFLKRRTERNSEDAR